VLHHDRLEDAVIHRIASVSIIRRCRATDPPDYDEALRGRSRHRHAFRADLVAVYDRDPATSRFIDPLLYFKGFHAFRPIAWRTGLHQKGRKDFAYYLQSRSSAVFQTGHQSNARIGRGIFLDHAPVLSLARPP